MQIQFRNKSIVKVINLNFHKMLLFGSFIKHCTIEIMYTIHVA